MLESLEINRAIKNCEKKRFELVFEWYGETSLLRKILLYETSNPKYCHSGTCWTEWMACHVKIEGDLETEYFDSDDKY